MTSSGISATPNRIFGSIRSQLVLGYGLMLVLSLVIAVIGYQSLQNLRTSVQTTLDEASRIRELSLEIEVEFLQARQEESNFLAAWRSLGFERARAEHVVANNLHLEQARSKLNEINKVVQNSSDSELQQILADTASLVPLLDTYETAFQAVVSDIEERSHPYGQESTLNITLYEIETIVFPLPIPELYQLVLQIRANEQSYLNTGQRQYYDNLRLLINEFTELVQNGSQVDLPEETVAIPDVESEASEPPEETVEIPVAKLLDLIGIYQANLTGLVALERDIHVNTIVFREVTIEINQFTSHILQEGDAGFTRARDLLQAVSDQSRLALTMVSILALGPGSLAAFILARRIIGPLNQLSDTAQKLGQGDLTQTVQITGGIELVTLANSFNTMAAQLRELVGSLEQRVAERTAELEESSRQLEKRAGQFEIVAQLAHTITSIQSLETLLPRITQLVSQQFDFYHVGLFLLDESRQYAVLSAANSEGGQRMLARKHRLGVGQTGIVGYVTATGNSRIALDTGADAFYFDNPDLPETRSEMALPLRAGGIIIGALDVQSTEPNAFFEDDVEVISILADEVSIAIENARLYAESQRVLADAQSAFGEFTQEAWQKMSKTHKLVGYELSGTIIRSLDKPVENNDSSRSIPIKMRDTVIGKINIDLPEGQEWDPDEIDITQALAERVGVAIESATLLEESRRRAARESMIGEISAKLSATAEIDRLMQVAVKELRDALGASEVTLKIETDDKSE